MKHRTTTEKMTDKIDKFSGIWSTVIAFPNLSKMKTKEYLELEKRIKNWKKVYSLNFSPVEREILEKIKKRAITEKQTE